MRSTPGSGAPHHALDRWIKGHQLARLHLFVFAVPHGAWWFFPSLVLLMGVAGLLACWVPTRRALSIQPVEALRYDG